MFFIDLKSKKTRVIIAGTLFVLGIFVFGFIQISKVTPQAFVKNFKFPWGDTPSPAQAATAENIRGWGWSEGVGWISMNCYNDYGGTCSGGSNAGNICADNSKCSGGTCAKDGKFNWCCPGNSPSGAQACPYNRTCNGGSNAGNSCSTDTDCSEGSCGFNYGVDYNTSSYKVTGWAWADGIGWVCFGQTCNTICLGGTNDGNTCSSDSDCTGGKCGGKPPFGRAKSWACVGMPTWTCNGGSNNGLGCGDNNHCPSGFCEFGCSGDKSEDFLNTANLQGHWKMDNLAVGAPGAPDGGCEGESNCTPDGVGIAYPAFLRNGPIQADGKWGNGLQFDGINDYIDVADADGISFTNGFTVEAWIKRKTLTPSSEQTILGKWDETTGAEKKSYRLWFGTDSKLNFSVGIGTTTAATITQKSKCTGKTDLGATCTTDSDCVTGEICKNAPITDLRKWHHIAAKYVIPPNGTPFLRIFIDGEWLNNSGTTGTVPTSLTNLDQKLYFGAKKGSTEIDTYFAGVMDNVSVWSRPKTGNEIWDASKKEIAGWARSIGMGGGGWLSLRGFTHGDRVWGSYLRDYEGFYTLGGYMSERQNNETMDTSGLVAHWKMNEAELSGTTDEVVDTTGNYSGTSSGTTTNETIGTTKGMFGGAADLDGVDDYLNMGSNINLNPGASSYTLTAWIKTSNTPSSVDIIASKCKAGTSPCVLFYINNDGSFRMTVEDGSGNTVNHTDGSAINDGDWHHIVGVIDRSENKIKRFVDGAPYGTDVDISFVGSINPAQNFLVGAYYDIDDLPFRYFKGVIDNVAVYSVKKTSSQSYNIFQKKNPYSVGWGDWDYDDPPEPGEFDNLSLDNTTSCEIVIAQWDTSDWADSYSYWRCDDTAEGTCGGCTYTEHNYLGTCTTVCQESDTGLTANTGYCYKIQAYNETGDTWATNNPPTYPSPQWISTVLCSPTVQTPLETSTCGQMTSKWNWVSGADGYNVYRGLGSTGCDTFNSSSCELIGHLGEGLDYDADDSGTNDLLGHWKMNESSWTNDCSTASVIDSSTQGNHAKACPNTTGPVGAGTGLFSNAGIFDGSDDYVSIPNILDPNATDFTIEAWFKLDTLGKANDQVIISQEDGTGTGRNWLLINDSGSVGIGTDAVGSYIGNGATDGVVVPTAGSWYHTALTKAGTAIKIYVNGELQATGTQTAETSDGLMRIGIDKDGTNAFDGVIDNVAIYNIAKTPEQIRIDYEAGNCGGSSCSLTDVCHILDSDTRCGKSTGDASTCCYIDERIVPFTNYWYVITAISESGESSGSTDELYGQTICFPGPEIEEE